MKNVPPLLIAALALVLALAGGYALYNIAGGAGQGVVPVSSPPASGASQPSRSSAPDRPASGLAPDFTVYGQDGDPVRLSQFFGKPIVLNFWASWCGPCRGEMPDFDQKYAQFGHEIHFLMVNMTDGRGETVETASAFVQQNGYAFPVFYDTNLEAATAYGAYALPTTFFIDREGRVAAQAVGAIDGGALQQGIDMIAN